MTIEKALRSKSKSVGLYSKEDEKKTLLGISRLFLITSKYFDKALTTRQSEVIAEEILGTYQYRQLRFEDIMAICNEIKQSNTFKLTPARILHFISSYVKERQKLSIKLHQNLATEMNNSCGDTNLDERIHKSFRSSEKTTKQIIKKRYERFKYD